MNFIGWIRDLFGIQKDMYETKKTRLEIEKIEEEKRGKLITLATIEDVKKYDPKIQRIEQHVEGHLYDDIAMSYRLALRRFSSRRRRAVTRWVLGASVAILILILLVYLISR